MASGRKLIRVENKANASGKDKEWEEYNILCSMASMSFTVEFFKNFK